VASSESGPIKRLLLDFSLFSSEEIFEPAPPKPAGSEAPASILGLPKEHYSRLVPPWRSPISRFPQLTTKRLGWIA
jgi:hypothetical protein